MYSSYVQHEMPDTVTKLSSKVKRLANSDIWAKWVDMGWITGEVVISGCTTCRKCTNAST